MAPKKGKGKKKGKKSVADDPYDGFSAPTSLLAARFKQNATQAALPPFLMAPIMNMFAGQMEIQVADPTKSLTQVVIAEPIGPLVTEQLCKTFEQLYYTKMRALCFWNAELGDVGCAHVCSSVVNFQHLHKLEIRDCDMGEQACKALAASLRTYRNAALRMVILNHNRFGDIGPKLLKTSLGLQTRLHHLDLSFCGLSFKSGKHLSDLLGSAYCRLRTLNLEGNELRDEGVADLSEGVNINKTLQKLILANNCFDVENVQVLAKLCRAVHDNPSLSYLDLDGNLIGELGAAMLAETITQSPHLRSVVVTHQLPRESFQAINSALDKNKKPKKGKGTKKGHKGKKGKKKKK